jgi:hypothetical protein
MSNEITNESGIIKIEVTKDGKVVTASMYLENYLKVKKLHQISLGDDMIDSLINELDIHYVLPTNETINKQ